MFLASTTCSGRSVSGSSRRVVRVRDGKTHGVLGVFEERVNVFDEDVVFKAEQLDDLFGDPGLHDGHLVRGSCHG